MNGSKPEEALEELTPSREEDNHQEYISLFDNDDKQMWCGFITRNKQHRVGVDAY
jgi:hypothetical protein